MIRRRQPGRPRPLARTAGALLAAGLVGGLAAVSAILAPGLALAQGAPVIRVLEGAAAPDLSVAVNRAIVIESAEAFAEVSVANPAIADVAALSNRSIYILGKQAGRTTLTLLGPNGRLIANIAVSVGPDLAEFKERLLAESQEAAERARRSNELVEEKCAAEAFERGRCRASVCLHPQ